MIEWLRKLPDPLIGIGFVGGLWFGFNYAVLADRAMAKEASTDVMPSCISALERYESKLVPPRIGLGRQLGYPELDVFEDIARQAYQPRYLSHAEKFARCECAVLKTKSAMRFDYAVHTASFRIIAADSSRLLREGASDFLFSGACGALPNVNSGG